MRCYQQIAADATVPGRLPPNQHRTGLIIHAYSDTDIFMGTDNQVTSSNGFRLPRDEVIHLRKGTGDRPDIGYYFVTDVGTNTLSVLEQFDGIYHPTEDVIS